MSDDPDPRAIGRELERRCRSRHSVISVMAVTSMCLQLGATDEEADAVWFTVMTKTAPTVPSDCLTIVREALERVREERAWLG